MKKMLLLVGLGFIMQGTFAQRNDPPTYSDGDGNDRPSNSTNLFAGGSISAGFANYTFNVGANPEIGYSFSQWVDLGVAFNINYLSERADDQYIYNANTRYRSFNYGAGIFTRVYPVHFLFVQLQPEMNWIHQSAKSFETNQTASATFSAASLIAGVGYTQRMVGEGSYFLMIGLDLLNNTYSPYRDYNGTKLPIIRAGFDFYFRSKKNSKAQGL